MARTKRGRQQRSQGEAGTTTESTPDMEPIAAPMVKEEGAREAAAGEQSGPTADPSGSGGAQNEGAAGTEGAGPAADASASSDKATAAPGPRMQLAGPKRTYQAKHMLDLVRSFLEGNRQGKRRVADAAMLPVETGAARVTLTLPAVGVGTRYGFEARTFVGIGVPAAELHPKEPINGPARLDAANQALAFLADRGLLTDDWKLWLKPNPGMSYARARVLWVLLRAAPATMTAQELSQAIVQRPRRDPAYEQMPELLEQMVLDGALVVSGEGGQRLYGLPLSDDADQQQSQQQQLLPLSSMQQDQVATAAAASPSSVQQVDVEGSARLAQHAGVDTSMQGVQLGEGSKRQAEAAAEQAPAAKRARSSTPATPAAPAAPPQAPGSDSPSAAAPRKGGLMAAVNADVGPEHCLQLVGRCLQHVEPFGVEVAFLRQEVIGRMMQAGQLDEVECMQQFNAALAKLRAQDDIECYVVDAPVPQHQPPPLGGWGGSGGGWNGGAAAGWSGGQGYVPGPQPQPPGNRGTRDVQGTQCPVQYARWVRSEWRDRVQQFLQTV